MYHYQLPRAVGAWSLGVVVAGVASNARAQATFEGLGFAGSYPHSVALAISADGTTVVGESAGRPFRWRRETGMVDLGQLPAPFTDAGFARGVSADGSFVVGDWLDYRTEEEVFYAFGWNQKEGIAGLGPPPLDVFEESFAYGVSAGGNTIVGAWRFRPVVWNSAGQVVLTFGPGTGTSRGVSSDGSAIAGSLSTGNNQQAFRWTAASGLVSLGVLPGGTATPNGSVAFGISANGMFVVGHSSSLASPQFWEAFRWTADEGMIPLGDLPGGSYVSDALAASDDGSIVVGDSIVANNYVNAFIWDPMHGMRDLRQALIDDYGLGPRVEGWVFGTATGVSADGRRIVGQGTRPDGFGEAFLVDFGPPCPADFNSDQSVNSQDFFDFLTCFFAPGTCPPLAADFDADGQVTSADFFAFLEAFFEGCP